MSSNQSVKTNRADRTTNPVRNETGGAIAAYKGVKISGDSTTYDIPKVTLIAAVTDKCLGITVASFTNNTNMDVLVKGRLVNSGLNTAAASVGDFVYLTATGDLSLIPSILQVGQVETLAASGTLYINVDGMLSGVATLIYTTTDTITAFAGGGQANATQLTSIVNRVTVCATAGDSVKLPSSFNLGDEIIIINDGAAPCDIFPASGDYINNLAVDTAYRLPANGRLTLRATTTNANWRIKSVYGDAIWNSITAFAGGGQANATILNIGTNIVSTCATALDSVKLPAAFDLGQVVIVINNGAKVLDIFPASGDDLGMGADTAIPLIPKNTLIFIPITSNAAWMYIQDGWQESEEQDVPITGANWTTVVSKGQFIYKSGVWKLKDNKPIGNISTATNAITLSWTGLVFKNTANYFQHISGNPPNIAAGGTPYAITGYTIPNTATANVYASTNVSQIALDTDSLTLNAMPASTAGGIF